MLNIYVENGVVDESGFGNSKTFALSSNVYATKSEKRIDNTEKVEDKDLIVNKVRENGSISRAEVVELLGISNDSAYRRLKSLVNKGVLRSEKKGRYTRYYYKE